MNQSNSTAEPWGACPTGEIARMVERVRGRRRRRRTVRIGGAVAGLLVMVAVGTLAVSQLSGPAEYRYGGIGCSDTRPLLEQYAAGRLDAETTGRIDAHLEQCPHCGPLYRKMKSGQRETPGATAGRSHTAGLVLLQSPREQSK